VTIVKKLPSSIGERAESTRQGAVVDDEEGDRETKKPVVSPPPLPVRGKVIGEPATGGDA
jgi:hypothetical protein